MRCSQCDYPLWNLAARQCPECGSQFKPSDEDFVPNQVRFCCPRCQTAYYGTTPRGHLEPFEFECVGCHERVNMDEMVLRPAEGVDEVETRAATVPWIDRRSSGTIRAWFSMIGQSMTAPGQLGKGLPSESSIGAAWVYAVVTWFIFGLCGLGLPLGVVAVIMMFSGDGNGAAKMFAAGLGGTLGLTAARLLNVLIWGATIQGLLRVTGECTHGMGRSYEVLCYTTGPNVIAAIPCFGPYCAWVIGGIWQIVSATIMICTAQRVSGARAALAVLAYPVAAMVLGGIAYFGAIVFAMSAQGGFGPSGVGGVSQAVIDHAASTGEYPSSGLDLLQANLLTPADFVSASSLTQLGDVAVGASTLEEMMFMPRNGRSAMVQTVIDAEPDGIVASRVGDYVFTCIGVDPAMPGMWLVVECADPDHNPGLQGVESVAIGLSDGTRQWADPEEFAALLEAQNVLREAAGYPRLPDPRNVTHDAPAMAPPGG